MKKLFVSWSSIFFYDFFKEQLLRAVFNPKINARLISNLYKISTLLSSIVSKLFPYITLVSIMLY